MKMRKGDYESIHATMTQSQVQPMSSIGGGLSSKKTASPSFLSRPFSFLIDWTSYLSGPTTKQESPTTSTAPMPDSGSSPGLAKVRASLQEPDLRETDPSRQIRPWPRLPSLA